MLQGKALKKILFLVPALAVVALLAIALFHRMGGKVHEPVLDSAQIAQVDRVILERPDGVKLRFAKDLDGQWSFGVAKTARRTADVSSQGASLQDSDPSAQAGLSLDNTGAIADAAQLLDFLYVFNFWEIARIPSVEEARNWKDFIHRQGGSLKLKSGLKTLFRIRFARQGELFLVQLGSQSYAMQCPWKSSSWMDYFTGGLKIWQNRLLMDFLYSEIRSVEVRYSDAKTGTDSDTLSYKVECRPYGDASLGLPSDSQVFDSCRSSRYVLHTCSGCQALAPAVAENYFSAFAQISFEPLDDAQMGQKLYDLVLRPMEGDSICLSVFEKVSDSNNGSVVASGADSVKDIVLRQDIFKAVVVVRQASRQDTVQLPYVFLDRLAKNASWFR